VSTSTLGRATTAARGPAVCSKERQDVGRAQDNVEALQAQLADLEAEFKPRRKLRHCRLRSPSRASRSSQQS